MYGSSFELQILSRIKPALLAATHWHKRQNPGHTASSWEYPKNFGHFSAKNV
jgi:hypothetical protein